MGRVLYYIIYRIDFFILLIHLELDVRGVLGLIQEALRDPYLCPGTFSLGTSLAQYLGQAWFPSFRAATSFW